MKRREIKEAQKKARQTIALALITDLKKSAAKFSNGSKKLDKAIHKKARQLAKKIAKNIKPDQAIIAQPKNRGKVTTGKNIKTRRPTPKPRAPKEVLPPVVETAS